MNAAKAEISKLTGQLESANQSLAAQQKEANDLKAMVDELKAKVEN